MIEVMLHPKKKKKKEFKNIPLLPFNFCFYCCCCGGGGGDGC